MRYNIVRSTIEGLKLDSPRLSDSLDKWYGRIINKVNSVSYGSFDFADMFQDVMVDLVKLDQDYDIPIVKYNGKTYKKLSEDDRNCYLSRYGKYAIIRKDYVEKAKKMSFNSLVYLKLSQSVSDHTKKRYTKHEELQDSAKSSIGNPELELEFKRFICKLKKHNYKEMKSVVFQNGYKIPDVTL